MKLHAVMLMLMLMPGHALQPPPVLMRLGEEYFIRLDNAERRAAPRTGALQLQLTQRLSGGPLGSVGNGIVNRERRSEDPPISLDLTFHLLREVLQMARAEQLAQRASSNRKMMDFFGK